MGRIPPSRRFASKSTSIRRSFPEKHSPLSDRTPTGMPQVRAAWQNVVHASAAVASLTTRERHASLEWSSMMLKIRTTPVATVHSVASICQHSFGANASNRSHDDFGRFCGCASTNPRRTNTRCTVATDGTRRVHRWSRPRCHWIVVAP
jgi:hypothetical protein